MNATLSFLLLVIVLPFQVGGIISHQRLPRPSSGGRHLQREENESDSPSAVFLAETTATTVTPDPTKDFSNFVAFIDALVASASASDDSSFYSNWTSSLDHSGDATEDSNVNFSPSPEWMNDQIDQAVDSGFSSSGEFEHTVGSDINMADGETAPSTAVVNQLSYVGLTLSITLQVVVLVL